VIKKQNHEEFHRFQSTHDSTSHSITMSSLGSLGSWYSYRPNSNSAAYSTDSLRSGATSYTSLQGPTSAYGDIPPEMLPQHSQNSKESSRDGDRSPHPYAPSLFSQIPSDLSGFSYAPSLAKATPMPPPPWEQREQANKAQANSGSEQGSDPGLLRYFGQVAVGLSEATLNAARGQGFRSRYNNPQYIEGGGQEPPVYYRDPCPYDFDRHSVYASDLQHPPPERNAHAEYKPGYKW
jgi:hypothetical protein